MVEPLLIQLDVTPEIGAPFRFDDLGHLCCAASDDGDKDGDDGKDGGDTEIGIATKTRTKPKKPSQYKVLLLNDDYTPMEFVVMVLKRFFSMDIEQATRVMLHVHQKGVGICGVFSYEVAETKVNQVMDFAKQNQHPLQCTLEQE
ncbi:MAG: ATP-dependent Clp protease adapter ClpS [Erythrobacter sp.]